MLNGSTKPLPKGEDVYSMLSECLAAMRNGDPRLDEWDETFLFNMENLLNHSAMSPKQAGIVRAIWESLQK